MSAAQDFTLEQGTDIEILFTVKQLTNDLLPFNAITNPYIPINITSNSISMMLRTSYDSSTPVLTATTTNGKFVITNGPAGLFSLILDPADTFAISFKGDSVDLVYDIFIMDLGNKETEAFRGVITVLRASTR